MRADRVGLSLT